MTMMQRLSRVNAINWNRLQDDKDLEVWNRLTSNYRLPEKVPLSNDIQSWNTLTQQRSSLLSACYGSDAAGHHSKQRGCCADGRCPRPHEEAVYTNIAFMESVHARSYSSIFSTLCATRDVDDAFRWSENPTLQMKSELI